MLTKVIACLGILVVFGSLAPLAHAQKVAAVRGNCGSSVADMVVVYADEVVSYGDAAQNIEEVWKDLNTFDIMWIGFPNSNPVFNTFTAHKEEFLNWLKKGGKFVATTASSDIHQLYELLPGTVRTQNQHRRFEAAHIIAKNHDIVRKPNDISDDAYYTFWAWTSGDFYTQTDEYIVIATETAQGNNPTWLVHASQPVVVTTIQPTWSEHPHPKMVENMFEYVMNFNAHPVNFKVKLAATWGTLKYHQNSVS